MARLRLLALLGLLAGAIRLLLGNGLVNYDTLYAMVWGRDLAHGRLPDYSVSVAPTPHPLATALSVVLSPLSSAGGALHGQSGVDLVLAAAFLSLALLGYVVFRLGSAWFGPWAGALAALLVLTRVPVLDFGARAYVDIPYLVLVLWALLLETRRRWAGAPVLGLLGVAGLLRPEAWLLAGAYWLWLAWGGLRGRALAQMAALAALGPLLWLLGDWAITGDPLHSLSGTRHTAKLLGRVTGLQNVPRAMPQRLGEVVREPVLFGGFVGGALSLLWLRGRALLGAAVGVLAVLAFCVLAAAGLPIITRYVLLPGVILCLFCGAGAFGWLSLAAGDRRRRWWSGAAALAGVVLLVFLPGQVSRLRTLHGTLAQQGRIQGDLAALVRSRALGAGCPPLAVPNHRPVPLLSLWLEVPPREIGTAPGRRGAYLTAADRAVAKAYVLDKRDPVQVLAAPPPGLHLAARNRSWLLYRACGS